MSKKLYDAFLKYMNSGGQDGDDLLAVVNNYKEAWVRDRQQNQDRKWSQQRSFYAGDHYVRQSEQTSGGYRVRLRENHLNNTVQRIQSIFVQNMPIVRAFPVSDDWNDVQNAETTEMFMKSYWRQNQLENKYGDLMKRACIFGNGFVYTYFDHHVSGKLSLDPSETQSGDPEVHAFKGDIKVKVESPMMYAFRPGIYALEDHYDFVRQEPVAKADLESVYGEIESEPVKIFNSMTGTSRCDEDIVIQNHYFHKPTPWFPEGLYVCWAGKKLLKAVDYPFEDGELPIDHMPFDTVPDQFWALSPMEQLMDLQEQLNRAASMIVEARNLIARPRVFASNESQIPVQSLSDRPGEVIRYKLAGGKPEFYVPPFNFGELAAHKGDVRNAIGFVSGMSGASRGEVPVQMKTASALQMVLEQDRSQFAPMIKRYHGCINGSARKVLSRAAQYIPASDPRAIKIEGQNGTARWFHGGMVPTPLDIYLEDTNPLGWTPGVKAERIESWVNAGLIKNAGQAAEMMQMNIAEPAYEAQKINRQAAQKEIEVMNKGEPIEIGPADLDEVHLEEHNKFIASFNFRNLPQPVREFHIMHRQAHLDRLASQMPPPDQGLPSGDIKASEEGNLAPPMPGGADMPELGAA